MFPQLLTFGKTFQTKKLNFSDMQTSNENTIYRIQSIVDNQRPTKELRNTFRNSSCTL